MRDEGKGDSPGAVWGLEQGKLNQNQNERDAILPNDEEPAGAAILEAFGKIKVPEGDKKILAIASRHFDLRQMMQASEFTLHGKEQPIEDLEDANKFLVRVEIPSEAKPKIRHELMLLNVEESSLFPDLAHWATEVKSKDFRH